MTAYPADYNACTRCPARKGERCYLMSSGGPRALPSVYADLPHSGRKVSGEPAGTPLIDRRSPPVPRAEAIVRRGAASRRKPAKTTREVAAWRALAERAKR